MACAGAVLDPVAPSPFIALGVLSAAGFAGRTKGSVYRRRRDVMRQQSANFSNYGNSVVLRFVLSVEEPAAGSPSGHNETRMDDTEVEARREARACRDIVCVPPACCLSSSDARNGMSLQRLQWQPSDGLPRQCPRQLARCLLAATDRSSLR